MVFGAWVLVVSGAVKCTCCAGCFGFGVYGSGSYVFLWCNMVLLVVGFSSRVDYCWCLGVSAGCFDLRVLLFRVGV